MSSDWSWIGLGILAALGGAGVAVFGKIELGEIDATLATTLRSLVMSLVLLGLCLSTGRLTGVVRGTAGIDGRAAAFIVLAGLSGALSWLA